MKKLLLNIFLLFFAFSINALTLNLKNVSMETLINTVSEATGRNFIVDPRVKGTVNVVSSTEISNEEFYNLFLSILRVHGYIVVDGDEFSKILPQSSSKNSSAKLTSVANDALVTTVIPIKNVAASQMIAILRPVISRHGHIAAYAASNTILVIDTNSNIERLKTIIKQLDIEIDDDYELIPIEHASVDEIAKIIKSLLPNSAKSKLANPLTIAVDKNNNQLIVGGAPAKRLKVRFLVKELDKKHNKSGNTSVVYLKYAEAKDILPVLQSIGKQIVDDDKSELKGLNIQSDEATNSIIITAPAEISNNIKSVIEKLDIRRAQVLIEAIIAEISSDDLDTFGFQWVSQGAAGHGLIDFTGSLQQVLQGGSARASQGLTTVFADYNQDTKKGFGTVLSALKRKTGVNILSTPSIVTIDNKEASILVGEEVPFITNRQIVSGNSNPFQNFERKDIGVKLKVTPQINAGDIIKLDIEQEISKVTNQGSASDIVTSKRNLKTSVLVENGKILVLGGLIDDTIDDTNYKVPGLGDIPVLGKLFQHKTKTKVKRNLLIFIHPTILTDQSVADSISLDKYNYIRARQMLIDMEELDLKHNRDEIQDEEDK
jgi:general secretion pathway protein D